MLEAGALEVIDVTLMLPFLTPLGVAILGTGKINLLEFWGGDFPGS